MFGAGAGIQEQPRTASKQALPCAEKGKQIQILILIKTFGYIRQIPSRCLPSPERAFSKSCAIIPICTC